MRGSLSCQKYLLWILTHTKHSISLLSKPGCASALCCTWQQLGQKAMLGQHTTASEPEPVVGVVKLSLKRSDTTLRVFQSSFDRIQYVFCVLDSIQNWNSSSELKSNCNFYNWSKKEEPRLSKPIDRQDTRQISWNSDLPCHSYEQRKGQTFRKRVSLDWEIRYCY